MICFFFLPAGAGINTKVIQSDRKSKLVDPYATLNKVTSPESMTCNNLPKNSVSEYFSNCSTAAD